MDVLDLIKHELYQELAATLEKELDLTIRRDHETTNFMIKIHTNELKKEKITPEDLLLVLKENQSDLVHFCICNHKVLTEMFAAETKECEESYYHIAAVPFGFVITYFIYAKKRNELFEHLLRLSFRKSEANTYIKKLESLLQI